MTDITTAGAYHLAGRAVHRMGYGAMQLAGPGVFGPPKDRGVAIAVLREAVATGVDHIDTSDFYGPHVVNEIIREALHPYPDDLTIVTKVGARRGDDASWNPAYSPEDLVSAVHDNLRNLDVGALDVVNLRVMGREHVPDESSIEATFSVLVDLQRQGLIKHLGLSNVTSKQVAQARGMAPVVCVQNHYNLAHRHDDALIDELAALHIAYVLRPAAVSDPLGNRRRSRCDADAGGAGVAARPLAQHPADPGHELAWTFAREPGRGGAEAVGPGAAAAGYDRRGDAPLKTTRPT